MPKLSLVKKHEREFKIKQVLKYRKQGFSLRDIAMRIGRHYSWVWQILKKYSVDKSDVDKK